VPSAVQDALQSLNRLLEDKSSHKCIISDDMNKNEMLDLIVDYLSKSLEQLEKTQMINTACQLQCNMGCLAAATTHWLLDEAQDNDILADEVRLPRFLVLTGADPTCIQKYNLLPTPLLPPSRSCATTPPPNSTIHLYWKLRQIHETINITGCCPRELVLSRHILLSSFAGAANEIGVNIDPDYPNRHVPSKSKFGGPSAALISFDLNIKLLASKISTHCSEPDCHVADVLRYCADHSTELQRGVELLRLSGRRLQDIPAHDISKIELLKHLSSQLWWYKNVVYLVAESKLGEEIPNFNELVLGFLYGDA
jgi:hypothetical protein